MWRRLSPFLSRMGPGRLRFQHGMYQRVAYEGLSFRRRREIHLDLGNALERDGAEPAVLSLHFWRAHDHARAFQWSSTAALAAQRSYANAEAAELYQRALASAARSPVDEDDIAQLAEALGDVLELTADYDAAAVAYTDARRAAGNRSTPTAARLHRKMGVLRERAGSYPDALRWYSRAIRVLDARGAAAERVELAELELAYAGARYRQGKVLDAREWAVRAVDHATDAGDDRALGHGYYLLTIIDVALGDTAPPSGGVALALLEREGDLVQQAKLYNNLGIAAYFAGDWDAALGHYERVPGPRPARRRPRARSHRRQQHRRDPLRPRRAGRGDPPVRGVARGVRDRQVHASASPSRSATSGAPGCGAGDLAEARRLLEEARRQFESIHAGSFVAETLVRLAECAVAAGDPVEALALVEQAEQRLRATPDSFVAVGAARVRAEGLLAAGQLTGAVSAADRAIALARQSGATFEHARSLDARAAAARALAAAAARDGEEAAKLLADLGVRHPPPPWGRRRARRH